MIKCGKEEEKEGKKRRRRNEEVVWKEGERIGKGNDCVK